MFFKNSLYGHDGFFKERLILERISVTDTSSCPRDLAGQSLFVNRFRKFQQVPPRFTNDGTNYTSPPVAFHTETFVRMAQLKKHDGGRAEVG
jgi:hypothetical protein